MSVLKNLMVDTKSAWVDYPGYTGLSVKVATLARQELISLRKSCMTTKFNRKTRQAEEELDEKKFIHKFTKATIKDWKGFKYKYLEDFIPVDISEMNPEEEMPYTAEDAELLVENSGDFDSWLNDVVFDLDNFRTERNSDPVEETGKLAK